MKNLPTLMGVVATLLAGACTGSETGNGARETKPVEVRMTLVPGSDGRLLAADQGGSAFEIVDATAIVDRIDLLLPDGEACVETLGGSVAYEAFCTHDEGRVRVEGPWVFDLVTGESSPSLEALELPLGPVERVEVRLAPGARDAWTIAADGIVGERDFRLELRMGDVIRFEGEGLTVDAMTVRLGLDLDPAGWFAGVDLTACDAAGGIPTDAEGVLLLDRASVQLCGPIATKITGAVRMAAKARSE